MHGNGFTFSGYSGEELFERATAAIALWRDEEKRARLVGKIMRMDFSWSAAAREYLAMYDQIQHNSEEQEG